MKFLNKLRNKPERVRKIILWLIVIIVALILGSWWFYSSYNKIKNFPTQEILKELELPEIEGAKLP